VKRPAAKARFGSNSDTASQIKCELMLTRSGTLYHDGALLHSPWRGRTPIGVQLYPDKGTKPSPHRALKAPIMIGDHSERQAMVGTHNALMGWSPKPLPPTLRVFEGCATLAEPSPGQYTT
jgi:hypothetical protein